MPAKNNIDKVLEKIEDLANLVQKGNGSEEEIQKIYSAVRSLQMSINDIVEKKVSQAINNQVKLCKINFDRILEKIEELVSKVESVDKETDVYRKNTLEDFRYYKDNTRDSTFLMKESLSRSIDELKESFREHKENQKEEMKEKEETKRSWRNSFYSAMYSTFFGICGSIVLLLILYLIDHCFKLGLAKYLNAPCP